ncbi:MAG: hypothetical protein AVDCRST_MAG57-2845, partial [uncultured Blastococcus sp.]
VRVPLQRGDRPRHPGVHRQRCALRGRRRPRDRRRAHLRELHRLAARPRVSALPGPSRARCRARTGSGWCSPL